MKAKFLFILNCTQPTPKSWGPQSLDEDRGRGSRVVKVAAFKRGNKWRPKWSQVCTPTWAIFLLKKTGRRQVTIVQLFLYKSQREKFYRGIFFCQSWDWNLDLKLRVASHPRRWYAMVGHHSFDQKDSNTRNAFSEVSSLIKCRGTNFAKTTGSSFPLYCQKIFH